MWRGCGGSSFFGERSGQALDFRCSSLCFVSFIASHVPSRHWLTTTAPLIGGLRWHQRSIVGFLFVSLSGRRSFGDKRLIQKELHQQQTVCRLKLGKRPSYRSSKRCTCHGRCHWKSNRNSSLFAFRLSLSLSLALSSCRLSFKVHLDLMAASRRRTSPTAISFTTSQTGAAILAVIQPELNGSPPNRWGATGQYVRPPLHLRHTNHF